MFKLLMLVMLVFGFVQDNHKPVPMPKVQVKENKEKLAIFTASWCTPCQVLKAKMAASPRIQAVLKTKYLNQILRVDVDQEKSLAKEFKVTAYPTIVVYKVEGDKNVELRRLEGYTNIDDLLNLLAPNVKHLDLTPRR